LFLKTNFYTDFNKKIGARNKVHNISVFDVHAEKIGNVLFKNLFLKKNPFQAITVLPGRIGV